MKKFFVSLIVIVVLVGGGYLLIKNRHIFDKADTTYTVSFNTDGGSIVASEKTVKKNKTVLLPTTQKEGHTFLGWYEGEVLWTEETKVTHDVSLKAKWQIHTFEITFIVDGENHTIQCDYNEIPVCPVLPEKEGTATIEYDFLGWDKEIVACKEQATYEAQFRPEDRDWEILVTTNNTNGGTFSGTGEFLYGTNHTISVIVNNGYFFDGLYDNGILFSSDQITLIKDLSRDYILEAKFTPIKKSITYLDTLDVENLNPTKYDIEDGTFDLVGLEKEGYDFKGWFTESNGEGTKVTQINSSLLENYTLYAHFEIINYTILYNMNDGQISTPNRDSFTIETESFVIQNPTKYGMVFLGWSGTGIDGYTQYLVIGKGSTGDRVYTANFEKLMKEITFVVDGLELTEDELKVEYNHPINKPDVDSLDYGMSGYSIDGWYLDEDCEGDKFNFGSNATTDLTLYGTWEFILGYGFYEYIDEFESANTTNLTSIDSFEELLHWVEFIEFYDIEEKYYFELTYDVFTEEKLCKEICKAIDKSTFPTSAILGYTYNNLLTKASIYVLTSFSDVECSLTCENACYTQQEYALNLAEKNERAGDFDDFNINNVNKEIVVKTSNQLVYALENGLEPVCEKGSKAEIVYLKAKEILRKICTDSMSDVQKAQAIFEWLVLNVNYDYYALNHYSDPNISVSYDSWYAEGALIQGKSVCDGYAKAFIILCKLENIPAVRVTGNYHAWNKIYIDGKWYGVDATHGDLGLNGEYEVINYREFMFTDEFKINEGYATLDFEDLKCETLYNFYETMEYTYASKTFDLYINSQDELKSVINYAKSEASKNTKYYVVEVSVDKSLNKTITNLLVGINLGTYMILGDDEAHYDCNGNRVYTFVIAS